MPNRSYFTYLTPTTRDESWQVACTTVGRVHVQPLEQYPFHKDEHPPEYTMGWEDGRILNEYQCLYITEGHGKFYSRGTVWPIEPGTFIVLLPGIRHWYKPDETSGWTEYWAGFRGSYPDELFRRGFVSPEQPVRQIGYHNSIVRLYDDLIEYSKIDKKGIQQMMASTIMMIIARSNFFAEADNRFLPQDLQLVEKAKLIFEEHLFSTLDIESMADSLQVSYKHLRELFNSYTGLSPYQYFLNLKMNKAKELLSEGNLSVKELSFKLAFDNPYYFSRLFKKKTGVSPSKWNGKDIRTDLDYLE